MKDLALLMIAISFVAACDSGGPGDEGDDLPDAPSAVTITTGSAPPPRFIPQTTALAAGGTVTFTSGSPVDHNVVSATNAWPAHSLVPGESFSVTLNQPGNYAYSCTIHEGMSGLISVQ